MERRITAEEVREFILSCDKEFRQAGFYLRSVRFDRTQGIDIPRVILSYTEIPPKGHDTESNETDRHYSQTDTLQTV